MTSFGLVCLAQAEPCVEISHMPFEIEATRGVVSHRGDSSPFVGLFSLLQGCTYHIGFHHNDDYFSAWDLLETGKIGTGSRSKVLIKQSYLPGLMRLLAILVEQSPQGQVLIFADHQGLPPNIRVLPAVHVSTFARNLTSRGLTAGWVYLVSAGIQT